MTITKTYATKASAKRALHRIFGVGPYSSNGEAASARFCDGRVRGNILELSSSYWGEASLWLIIKKGIDAV